MMILKRYAIAGVAALASALAVPAAHAAYVGPTPYLSAADSPFNGTAFDYFFVEDFDDGAVSTPGLGAATGSLLNFGSLIDSVGGAGNSWYSGGGGNTVLRFTFDAAHLPHGRLPTHAGIVWTDVGYQAGEAFPGPFAGVGRVEFEAFDPQGGSLGVLAAEALGDGQANGGTAEDRFFGFASATGISRIELRMPSSDDWEADHVQYGFAAIPEPGTYALVLSGLLMLGFVARRRLG